jgi:hypothetical protein
MLDTTPTTIAGIAAVPEVLGTDPYNEGDCSSAAWAYNNIGVPRPGERASGPGRRAAQDLMCATQQRVHNTR